MSRAAAIAGTVLGLAALVTVAALAVLGFLVVVMAAPVCALISSATQLLN